MLLHKNKTIRQLSALLETGNLLTLKLMLKQPKMWRVFPGMMYRSYMELAKTDQWQSRDVRELFPGSDQLQITLEPISGHGVFASLDELATLAILTKSLSPQKIFEIGTFRGRTALNFALNSPDDCQIYTLDLPTEERQQAKAATNSADRQIIEQSITGIDYQNKAAASKITQLYGDSTKFDFREYYGEMDIVFIDGAHHYEAVYKDSLNAKKMLRPGGAIVWHDFANYGDYNDVTRAILALFPASQVYQLGSTQLALYRAPQQ